MQGAEIEGLSRGQILFCSGGVRQGSEPRRSLDCQLQVEGSVIDTCIFIGKREEKSGP